MSSTIKTTTTLTLTRNQFATLGAIAAGIEGGTANVARAAGIVWHSANVAIKALKAKGLLDSACQLADMAPAQISSVVLSTESGPVALTRNQFKALLATTAGITRTCEIARAASMTWHSARVAVQALERKGLLGMTEPVAAKITTTVAA